MELLPQVLGPARSLCPVCLGEAEGAYFAVDDRVVLRRWCAAHGTIESPFWEDVRHFEWTQSIEGRASGHASGACCPPGTAGCDSGGVKRCVTVLPVTDGCNLECPYCFAASGPKGVHRSLEEVEGMLRGAFRQSGGPTPLQLSGGEPTVHPRILEIAQLARAIGYTHIEVNTNGLLVANRPRFALALREAGVSTLYLQFDGLDGAAYRVTRGLDLMDAKRRSLENARAAGLTVILAPTIVKGRNDHVLGDILRFALANRDVVRGVNIQPVRHFGRYAEDTGHLSLDAVARLIESQTGFLRSDDLVPFPCCSATCYLGTLLLATPTGGVPLTRFLREETFFEALGLMNERQYMDFLAGNPEGTEIAEQIACACGLPFSGLAGKVLAESVFVSVSGFMDAHTADLDRMSRCCVRVVTRSGRLAPFCGYYLTDAEGAYAWRERHYPEDRELPLLQSGAGA